MKKVKLVAIVVLVLSVVGLGVLGAKKMLQILEERSSRAPRTSANAVSVSTTETATEVAAASPASVPGSPDVAVTAVPTSSPAEPLPTPFSGDSSSATSAVVPSSAASQAPASASDWREGFVKWVAFAADKGVHVRAGPDVGEKLLFVVGKGTKGTVTDRRNGWSELKWDFNRQTGWVRDDLLMIGPDEVMQSFVRPDGSVIGTYTPELVKEATIKARTEATAAGVPPDAAVTTVTASVESDVPAPIVPVASGEKLVAYAAQKGVNVRAGPATRDKLLFLVGKGTKGIVTAKAGNWSQIKWEFNRKSGWVRNDLLIMGPEEVMRNFVAPDGTMIASFTPDALKKVTKKAQEIAKNISVGVARPAPPSETVKGFTGGKLPEEAIVSQDGAKLRETPSTKAAVVGRLHKGVSVKIKAMKQIGKYQWFDVDYSNGRKIGWTREDNLQF
ncbi:MAG TPA: SH3 domain-containing protein [Candidatus Ozemobacteraceae bacterium]|nr:SH3 domain-containing protein [Candidatus Ozemobacteraceae bacterium]